LFAHVEQKLDSWKGHFLSQDGRLTHQPHH